MGFFIDADLKDEIISDLILKEADAYTQMIKASNNFDKTKDLIEFQKRKYFDDVCSDLRNSIISFDLADENVVYEEIANKTVNDYLKSKQEELEI